ncbi:MAG: hypothetical protein JW849_00045 [Phycisphaerae bacterium]|nr:hypothetical protein [Phycisphaerae bacterium]
MFPPASFISVLAADDGDGVDTVIQIALFILIAAGSIISAYFKKAAEKRQQEKARQKAEEAKGILARKTQREQARRQTAPQRDASLGMMKKQPSLRDFIQNRAAPPVAPPPVPPPRPSMFAAPPKPVPRPVHVEESHLTERTPIKPLPEGLDHPTPVLVERKVLEPAADLHTRVNLADGDIARAAIIFHEILSPPRALRTTAELWE